MQCALENTCISYVWHGRMRLSLGAANKPKMTDTKPLSYLRRPSLSPRQNTDINTIVRVTITGNPIISFLHTTQKLSVLRLQKSSKGSDIFVSRDSQYRKFDKCFRSFFRMPNFAKQTCQANSFRIVLHNVVLIAEQNLLIFYVTRNIAC